MGVWVIGKLSEVRTYNFKPGEYSVASLLGKNYGNSKDNWSANRHAIDMLAAEDAIFKDLHVDPTTGKLLSSRDPRGFATFLTAERYELGHNLDYHCVAAIREWLSRSDYDDWLSDGGGASDMTETTGSVTIVGGYNDTRPQ